MPNSIALEWGEQHIVAVEGGGSGSLTDIRRLLRIDRPAAFADDEDTEQAGQWLKQQLANHGIRSNQAHICVPRHDVVTRQIEVPNIDEAELPGLVHMQAETSFATSVDQLALDFLCLPRNPDAETRQVVMATINRETLQRILRITKSAGIDTLSVGISSIAVAQMAMDTNTDRENDVNLIVFQNGQRLEMTLCHGSSVLFMHSGQLTVDDSTSRANSAWTEIRRALGAQTKVSGDLSVDHCFLIGSPQFCQSLQSLCEDRLRCDVETIDPIKAQYVGRCPSNTPDSTSVFAPPVGLLRAANQAAIERIDFLNPRRPVVQKDYRQIRLRLAAAAVALVTLISLGVTRWQVGNVQQQISDMQRKLDDINETVKKGQPIVKANELLKQWDQRNIDWLQHMLDINTQLPGTDTVLLKDCRFDFATGGNGLGQITANGLAKTRQAVEQLCDRLAQQAYVVTPHGIERTAEGSDYPFQFQLKLTIPQSPETGSTHSAV